MLRIRAGHRDPVNVLTLGLLTPEYLRRQEDFPFEPEMSEATRRSGERIHVALSSAWGVPYVVQEYAGIGRARCRPPVPRIIAALVSRSTIPWIA
eukprot:3594850-Pyramimonas_sp.AAC.1